MSEYRVDPTLAPHAFGVMKQSTDWGNAANASQSVDVGDALAAIHRLLNTTIEALGKVEAELNRRQ